MYLGHPLVRTTIQTIQTLILSRVVESYVIPRVTTFLFPTCHSLCRKLFWYCRKSKAQHSWQNRSLVANRVHLLRSEIERENIHINVLPQYCLYQLSNTILDTTLIEFMIWK